jgi:ankyrin repeat protein
LAASKGKVDIVKLLVTSGADLKAKNNAGETALTLSKNYKGLESWILSQEKP